MITTIAPRVIVARALLCVLAAPVTVAAAAAAQPDPASCRALTGLELPATIIRSAEVVSSVQIGATTEATPGLCRVVARSRPAVNFEVWLPLEGWNGRFQGVGNGGMAGSISRSALLLAVQRGYAAASTDTGHQAGEMPFDASWALNRADLIEDFGHRALHLTTVHGKRITASFYGRPASKSYYVGCSKGGQQGLMEAQRYPEDYDGLLVGDPANAWTRFYAGAHLWYSLATLADPESYLPPEKATTLGNAVNAACDALDGVTDGVLMDPRRCLFDPGTLTCPTGTDTTTCLTPKQVTAVRRIWSGVTNSRGETVFPGLVPGGEAAPGGWPRWVTGPKPFASLHWLGGEGFFRHFVFKDPDWNFRTFDYDRDLSRALREVGPAVDADDPDLSPLRARGARLIVYHGWSDPDISPLGTIDYWNRVVDVTGRGVDTAAATADVQSFFRLFMAPGLGHCRGGPGPDQLDALSALEDWVERGVAPATIVASKLVDGEVTRTLPLCPYPQQPLWDENGDPMIAASYRCR